jgi:hypothetical protein
VLIRPKYHWFILSIVIFDLLMGIVMMIPRRDPFYAQFMSPFYTFVGAIGLILWATTCTTLSGGVLQKRVLFFTWKRFNVDEIVTVEPHRKNGKWSYGTVVTIRSKSGEKLTLQPNHPVLFPAMLKQQAPGADFRV